MHVASGGGRSVSVTLTDDAGRLPVATIGDGAEVAIVAWRPNVSGGARYCVRTTDTGLEGWLAVGNLRAKEPVLPALALPKPVAPPAIILPPAASKPRGGRRPVPRRGTL